MKATIIALLITVSFQTVWAQQFIDKATIEFEVKKSILKDMGNNMWDEMMKENLLLSKLLISILPSPIIKAFISSIILTKRSSCRIT